MNAIAAGEDERVRTLVAQFVESAKLLVTSQTFGVRLLRIQDRLMI